MRWMKRLREAVAKEEHEVDGCTHMHKNKKHHHGSKIENNHINWSTLLDKSQSEVNGHAY